MCALIMFPCFRIKVFFYLCILGNDLSKIMIIYIRTLNKNGLLQKNLLVNQVTYILSQYEKTL